MMITLLTCQLRRRPLAALAMALVLALVVIVVAAASAWQRGLDRAARSGANPDITYLVARGAEDALERSLIEADTLPAITSQLTGPHAVEMVHMGPLLSGSNSKAVTWRGVTATSHSLRTVTFDHGHWPEPGEVALGSRIATELALAPGDSVRLLNHDLRVAGVLDAALGYAGGEVWLPLSDLHAITGRSGASLIALRDTSGSAQMLTLMRPDLGVVDVSEVDYLAGLAARLQPLRIVAWLIGGLLIAAALAGAIAAAAAQADARKETLATLRVLGWRPLRLATWLMAEQAVLAILAAGLLVAPLLWLDGTVLRLGGIAPVLRIDAAVTLAAAIALLVAAVLLVVPGLAKLFLTSLSRQLARS
ncbi:MAG: ABC transporter permease [Planctomycetota bacterium]|jgi:hypothetical protein|nr:ABC transporter permease [Planctomycetota bacterium]